MKKLIATIAISGSVASVFAQGYVNFSNGSTTEVSTNDGGTTGLTTSSSRAPQGYYYALMVQSYSGSGPTAANGITSLDSEGWLFSGIYATNSLSPGRFSGGFDVATTANTPIGGDIQYLVLGWSSDEGNNVATILTSLNSGNWASAFGFVGDSSVGIVSAMAGAPPATASTLFGTSPEITTGFDLDAIVIPEPTTLALAGVGGAALLWFRRRK